MNYLHRFTRSTESYRWLVWGIMLTAYAITFFHTLSMGVVKEPIRQEFGLSETAYVVMVNMFSVLYMLMQIPTGLMVDTLGPRKVSAVGIMVAGLGVALFSGANEVWVLFVGRALVGLGTSVIFVSILLLIARWFPPHRFGTMTGATCFFGTMGGVMAQTPLAVVVEAVGWRASFAAVAGLSFLTAALILFVVRDDPQELGFKPLTEGQGPVEKISLGQVLRGTWAVLCNPLTWPPFLVYAAYYGSYIIIMGLWGSEFLALAYDIDLIKASTLITLGVLGSAFGALAIGNVSDRWLNRKRPLVLSGVIYLFSWPVIILGAGILPLWLMGVVLFINGFMSCGYVMSWPLVKESNAPRYVGASTSVANIGGFMGSICMPLVVGLVFDRAGGEATSTSTYQLGLWVTTALVGAGLAVSLLTRETACQSIYCGKETTPEIKPPTDAEGNN